eukprot:GHUV01035345.1.p2 GENE.GHUV01035345.1~~GHUV01035345.1.p2  ORF type:complete len:109 (-),score=12.67 GHUV01035345.1:136-462(-)
MQRTLEVLSTTEHKAADTYRRYVGTEICSTWSRWQRWDRLVATVLAKPIKPCVPHLGCGPYHVAWHCSWPPIKAKQLVLIGTQVCTLILCLWHCGQGPRALSQQWKAA